jgi:protein-L-isoaspartate(D-aspartate) O-methyltransferase
MVDPKPEALMAKMVEILRDQDCLHDADVAAAFLSVPRHVFVPEKSRAEAYTADVAIPTHFDADGAPISSSSAPNIMSTMLEQLDVAPGMHVLEIGAGTGYNAGLLAHLVGVTGSVVSVELDAQVAREAACHLADAKVSGARVVVADGWLGDPDATDDGQPRFDRVIVTVGVWEVSPHWIRQVRVGGVLVLPLWLRPGVQVSVAFVREEEQLRSTSAHACGFMRLRGPHAGPEMQVAVPGWRDRVEGATPEREWIAAVEHAEPEHVSALRALLAGPVTATRVPLPAPGWTTRLALEETDVIALSGRKTWWHFACGLFAPEGDSLAVLDGGQLLAFGDPACGNRLRARLPALAPLRIADLEIVAAPHPAPAAPGVWVLERPEVDLVITAAGAAGEPVRVP